MNMKKMIFALACSLGVYVTPAVAADYEAGKQKAVLCAACHGEGGAKPVMPQTPILAGQYVDYLEHALRAYKKGTRQNPLMSPMATPLTEEDIANLAAYFSQQQGLWVRY
jgi:cytochrome c553